MQFDSDERRILEDEGYFEGARKILFTNKRIIFFKKKGLFGDYNLLERELPLTDISECTLQKNSIEGNQIRIKLRNGENHFLIFLAKLSALALGTIYDFDQTKSAITDKWLLAINQQIRQNIQENPLNIPQLRFAKGEISNVEYEERKKYRRRNELRMTTKISFLRLLVLGFPLISCISFDVLIQHSKRFTTRTSHGITSNKFLVDCFKT